MNTFLDKAEKYFKTDIRYIIDGGFWLTVAKIVSTFCAIASSVVFANYLPEETYGTFRYILSVFVIFSVFTLSGMDTAVVRSVSKGFAGTTKAAFLEKIKFGAISSVIGLAISGYYFYQGNSSLGIVFVLGAILAPFMESAYIYVAHLNGNKDFLRTSVFVSITRVVTAALLIFTVLFTQNIIHIISVFLLSNLSLRLLFLTITLRKHSWTGQLEGNSINLGRHLTVNRGLDQLIGNLDKFLVFIFIGPAALAGYYLALVPFKQLKNLLHSVPAIILPKISDKDLDELKTIAPRVLTKLYLVIIPAITLYWISAEYIFGLVFPLYVDFVLLSKIVFLLLLLYPAEIFHTSLIALGNKDAIYKITLVTNVVRALLLVIVVPVYGMWGAVATIIITHTINAVLKTFVFIKLPKES